MLVGKIRMLVGLFSTHCFILGSQCVYLQVLLTILTPVDKMQLFLNPYTFNKLRLDIFHSCDTKKCFVHEKYVRVRMTLIHIGHYQLSQLAVANCRQILPEHFGH
jgi:hypothetical protein